MNKNRNILLVSILILIGIIFHSYIISLINGIIWSDILKWSIDNSGFIQAVTAIFLVIVACLTLYYGSLRPWFRRPKLKLGFSEKKDYPFFHKLAFESFEGGIDLQGQRIPIVRPGFNARVQIFNSGKTTAKRVQARIEKIELIQGNNQITRHYHPTTVKWSGEEDWNPIDIPPKSFFFLDVFMAVNETSSEIISFNSERLRNRKIWVKEEILEDHVKHKLIPSEQIYWNVWVKNPLVRGIPESYEFQGTIRIFFIINGDNCSPTKFEAKIDWSFDNWNKPTIKIKQDSVHINVERN